MSSAACTPSAETINKQTNKQRFNNIKETVYALTELLNTFVRLGHVEKAGASEEKPTYRAGWVEGNIAILVVYHVLRQPQAPHQQRVPQQADDGPQTKRHKQVDVDGVTLTVQPPDNTTSSTLTRHLLLYKHPLFYREVETNLTAGSAAGGQFQQHTNGGVSKEIVCRYLLSVIPVNTLAITQSLSLNPLCFIFVAPAIC